MAPFWWWGGPSQQLMMLVPNDGRLEIEAVIGNKDVGFVETGQPAEVKIEAFTFTRYGLLHGVVREVSTDAVPEPRAEANASGTGTRSPGDEPTEVARSSLLVYASHIALEQTSMDINGRHMPLVPGTAVTAEIKTGERRVLDYLLSPLRQYAHDGLRERRRFAGLGFAKASLLAVAAVLYRAYFPPDHPGAISCPTFALSAAPSSRCPTKPD